MDPERPFAGTYVRIDQSALLHNFQQVAGYLGGRAKLCAVVKANGYGHGLVEAARLFAKLGCDALGVAAVEEGVRLRQAGVETPVLVFQPALVDELPAAFEHDLTITITQPEHVEALANFAAKRQGRGRYQIEVDIGLGRSGCRSDPAEFYRQAATRLGYGACGIWAHLGAGLTPRSLPGEPVASWRQARRIADRLQYLQGFRGSFAGAPGDRPLFHVAASPTICDTELLCWDMVRIGTLLYGHYPSYTRRRPFQLRTALELRTRIVELRVLPPDTPVGYGGEFRTRRQTRLATLPVGLSHGVAVVPESTVSLRAGAKRFLKLRMSRSGRRFRPSLVWVAGAQAPVVGRVSLNECNIDVTSVPAAKLGDEVAVPVRATTLNPAIPRVHVGDV